jgi:hypothetical protein
MGAFFSGENIFDQTDYGAVTGLTLAAFFATIDFARDGQVQRIVVMRWLK